jgi:hypothetical protein
MALVPFQPTAENAGHQAELVKTPFENEMGRGAEI